MSNDRFRFRVWDDTHKEYLPLCDCKLDARSGKIVKQSLFQENRYTIEQCTGLTDKNGKLIFEGDIIMFAGVKMAVEWSMGSCRWVLRYADKKHSLYGETMSMSAPNSEIFGNEYIIIGNIHDEQFRDATKMVEGDNND